MVKAVLSRVQDASVEVEGMGVVASLGGPGALVLVGVSVSDTDADAQYIARKIADLRITRNDQSLTDTASKIIVVSQFTLYADTRKGRRPSWSAAAGREQAIELYQRVGALLSEQGLDVQFGEFGADMSVKSINDGPFTLLLDSRDK